MNCLVYRSIQLMPWGHHEQRHLPSTNTNLSPRGSWVASTASATGATDRQSCEVVHKTEIWSLKLPRSLMISNRNQLAKLSTIENNIEKLSEPMKWGTWSTRQSSKTATRRCATSLLGPTSAEWASPKSTYPMLFYLSCKSRKKEYDWLSLGHMLDLWG